MSYIVKLKNHDLCITETYVRTLVLNSLRWYSLLVYIIFLIWLVTFWPLYLTNSNTNLDQSSPVVEVGGDCAGDACWRSPCLGCWHTNSRRPSTGQPHSHPALYTEAETLHHLPLRLLTAPADMTSTPCTTHRDLQPATQQLITLHHTFLLNILLHK